MRGSAEGIPRADVFRVTVNLRFLATDQGGRKGPAASGYRPPCWFGSRDDNGEKIYSDAVLYFHEGRDAYRGDDGRLWVPPRGSCRADALVLYPQYVRPLAATGSPFEVWEGKTVGTGKVEEVVDPGPERD